MSVSITRPPYILKMVLMQRYYKKGRLLYRPFFLIWVDGNLSYRNWFHTYLFFVTAPALVGNKAVYKRKQCIVPALANIISGMNPGSSLPHKDAASRNYLTVITFYTQHFGL